MKKNIPPPKLTVFENLHFTIEIAIASQKLAKVFDAIHECYPQRITRKIKPTKIEKDILELKSELDNEVFPTFKNLKHNTNCVYFSHLGNEIAKQQVSGIRKSNFSSLRQSKKPRFKTQEYRKAMLYLAEAKDLFFALEFRFILPAPKSATICERLSVEIQQIKEMLIHELKKEHGANHEMFQAKPVRAFLEGVFTDLSPFSDQIRNYLSSEIWEGI